MKRFTFVAIAALAAGVVTVPAVASVWVLGSSPGRGCYLSARAQLGTQQALNDCDTAFQSGRMNFDDTVATYVNRGIIKLSAKNPRAAVYDFDQAIAMKPDLAESYLNKGSALLRMGADRAEAIALFDEALERKTQRPELAYFGRAIAHELSGDIKSAYLDYQRAQQAAPRWEQPAQELSRFQVRKTGGAW